MKYRKKPIEIDAFKFYVDYMPEWFLEGVANDDIKLFKCDARIYSIEEAYCEIKTLEGTMIARGGDYIIKGIHGEIYPCKPEIFEKSYYPVE